MKKKIIITAIFSLLIVLGIFGCLYLSGEKADIVIYGNIYTGVDGETTSEALAIKDDKYIYVGNKDGVKKEKTKIT